MEKFREAGSVQNKKSQCENWVLSQREELAVFWQVAMDGEYKPITWGNRRQSYKCPACIETVQFLSA